MFSSKYLVQSFMGFVVTVGACCITLSSCHFGDDNLLEGLAKKKRTLDYHLTVSLPALQYSSTPVEDWGRQGLNLNWGNSADLAVLGKEFVAEFDSLSMNGHPEPIHLSYDLYRNALAVDTEDSTLLSFDFSAYARHGYGEEYATLLNVFYPFSALMSDDVLQYNAHCDSILLNFTGQDGRLTTLRNNYFYALGRARGICNQTLVQARDSALTESDQADINHNAQVVRMVPKIAIIRLSLVAPLHQDITLLDYVRSKNMLESGYYIDHIHVQNRSTTASGISKAMLNLNTGKTQAQEVALRELTITDSKRFWNHDELHLQDAQFLGAVGEYQLSWGTMLYLAVPCTDGGSLTFDPLITVYIRQVGQPADQAELLYGVVQTAEIQEGGYYITSPIKLQTSVDEIVEPAYICKVP